jgi:hypothetical protein
MNRWRLTRGPWTQFLRRAIRVHSGERMAASVLALVAFVGSSGMFLCAGLYAKNLARSMASRPGGAALSIAEAHSRLSESTATGFKRSERVVSEYYDTLPARRQSITWDMLDAIEVVVRRLGPQGLEGSIPENAVREHPRSPDKTHVNGHRNPITAWAVSEDVLDAAWENYVRRIYGSGDAANLRAGVFSETRSVVGGVAPASAREYAAQRVAKHRRLFLEAAALGALRARSFGPDLLAAYMEMQDIPGVAFAEEHNPAMSMLHRRVTDPFQDVAGRARYGIGQAPVREASSKIELSLTALSHDILGLTRIELTSKKSIPDDGPDPGLLASAFWPGIGPSVLLDQSVRLPLLSLTLNRPGSHWALDAEGVGEFFIEPRIIVQSPPPRTSGGAYAPASIAGSSPAHPDVMASVSGCDGSGPGGIHFSCGEYVAGDGGSAPQPPITLSAVMPRDTGVATTVCAGAACRAQGKPATPAAHEDSESIYSSLAASLQISAPKQPRVLPAPPSGWVDIGYVSPAPPRWKRTLAPICEASQSATPSALRAQCGPSATDSGVWGMSFQAAGLEGAFSSAGWHLNASFPSGFEVLVASALQTPLQNFVMDSSWGIRVSTPWGLQIIGASSGIQVLKYFDLSFGQLFAGITPQGPITGLQFEGETVNGNISGLMSGGQVQVVGDVTVRAGDFEFTSTLSSSYCPPATFDVPLDLNLCSPTSDLQLGVSYTFRNGPTVELSWSSAGGWSAAYMIPNGPTLQLSLSTDSSFGITLTSPIGSGVWPTIAPLGRAAFGFTQPSPFDPIASSMHFRWPLATVAQPPVPAAPGPSSASATVVIRFCVDNGDGVCRPAESRPPSRALVDGQSTATTDGRISLSPGHHTITVPLDLVPSRLVPLGDLTCDLTVSASTVGFCDLPVHRAGTP